MRIVRNQGKIKLFLDNIELKQNQEFRIFGLIFESEVTRFSHIKKFKSAVLAKRLAILMKNIYRKELEKG